jgi:hypothetical protein
LVVRRILHKDFSPTCAKLASYGLLNGEVGIREAR